MSFVYIPNQQPPNKGGQEAIVIVMVLALLGGGFWAYRTDHLPDLGGGGGEKPVVVAAGKPPSFAKPCAPKIEHCKPAKAYAYAKLAAIYTARTEVDKQFKCLDNLWEGESNWNDDAENPSSHALGIPQALGHGAVFKKGEWKKQIDWGIDYIHNDRKKYFTTPCGAWTFWQHPTVPPRNRNWY